MNLSHLEILVMILLIIGTVGILIKRSYWFTWSMMIGMIISMLSKLKSWHLHNQFSVPYLNELKIIDYLYLAVQIGYLLFAIGFIAMVISFKGRDSKNGVRSTDDP